MPRLPSATPSLRRARCPLTIPLILLTAAAFASSCGRPSDFADASKPPVLRPDSSSTISTGLNAIDQGNASPSALRSDAEPSSTDQTAGLLSLMEQAQRNSSVSVDAVAPLPTAPISGLASAGPAPLANPGLSFSLPAEPDLSITVPDLGPFPGVENPALPEIPSETSATRRARLIAELGALIDQEASGSSAPAPMLAQIAALKFLSLPPTRALLTTDNPGGQFGGATKPPPISPAGLNSPPDPLDAYLNSAALSPREKDSLAAWNDFVTQARSALLQHHDIAALAPPAQDLADSLNAWTPISITQARLCSKVDGFGVYRELKKFADRYKFLAGRPARMIVYIEPANFSRARISRDGVWGHEVSLLQDLRLFHAAQDSDTLVWRKPDQEITDFSRNRRRDFFVVQVIELPASLSVGAYRLKVIMTDKAGGGTGGGGGGGGGRAEVIIPIELVADASALRE